MVPDEVKAYARRCQNELVQQNEARDLAARLQIWLEGLGGTQDGVIGALAAVGLIADRNDGRLVQIGTWPDDLSGPQDVRRLRERGVRPICLDTHAEISDGTVDIGKRLRPNFREGRIVLFCRRTQTPQPQSATWQAVRFT